MAATTGLISRIFCRESCGVPVRRICFMRIYPRQSGVRRPSAGPRRHEGARSAWQSSHVQSSPGLSASPPRPSGCSSTMCNWPTASPAPLGRGHPRAARSPRLTGGLPTSERSRSEKPSRNCFSRWTLIHSWASASRRLTGDAGPSGSRPRPIDSAWCIRSSQPETRFGSSPSRIWRERTEGGVS